METEENQIVYSFPKGQGEEVQFAIRKFHQKYYADLRVWFHPEGQEEFCPSKKGISLDFSQMSQMTKGISELARAVEKLRKPAPRN